MTSLQLGGQVSFRRSTLTTLIFMDFTPLPVERSSAMGATTTTPHQNGRVPGELFVVGAAQGPGAPARSGGTVPVRGRGPVRAAGRRRAAGLRPHGRERL